LAEGRLKHRGREATYQRLKATRPQIRRDKLRHGVLSQLSQMSRTKSKICARRETVAL
jgi:hypothetical protein